MVLRFQDGSPALPGFTITFLHSLEAAGTRGTYTKQGRALKPYELVTLLKTDEMQVE